MLLPKPATDNDMKRIFEAIRDRISDGTQIVDSGSPTVFSGTSIEESNNPVSLDDVVMLTIPNNGTVTYSLTASAAGAVTIFGQWKRDTSVGYAVFKGSHDGTTATFGVDEFSGTPGFEYGNFAGAISGDDVVLTFAADNNVNDIELSLRVEVVQQIT